MPLRKRTPIGKGYVYDGARTSAFLKDFKGDKGDQGDPGINGIDGVDGIDGNDGDPGLVTVTHGTDTGVARPDALLVHWVGMSEPTNALPTDFWTRKNI